MKPEQQSYPGFGQESPIHSIQPGGGWGMSMELLWGKFRRGILTRFFKKYVSEQSATRQGDCSTCPGSAQGCTGEVIDCRDLKYFNTVCGYSFPDQQHQRFAWREKLFFARWGLAELFVFTLGCMLASCALGLLAYAETPYWLTITLSVLIFLFWLEIIWFFRDPPRKIPENNFAVVSPADGTIVEISEVDAEGFPEGKAFRIGIFLSVFNVHINRSPVTGTVTKLRYFPGRFLNAMKTVSARVNEQLWIDMQHDQLNFPLRVTQISGALARRIVCDLKTGQKVTMGQKFGMIKLGSRTELYLPHNLDIDLQVKIGDKVRGGSSVLLHIKN